MATSSSNLLKLIDNKVNLLTTLREKILSQTTPDNIELSELLGILQSNTGCRNVHPSPSSIVNHHVNFGELFVPRFESTLAETIVHLSIVTLSNEKKKKQSAKTGFEIVIVVGDHGSIQLIDKNGEILDSGAVELPAGIKVSAVAMVDTDAHIILALTNHNMVVIRFNVRLRGRLIAGRRHNCRDEQLNLDLDHDQVIY